MGPSYTVGRRTRELGIRMALGARGNDIVRMVLRRALAQVLLGVAIGIPSGVAASRLARSLLFGVGSADPVALLAAILAMCAAALVAAWLPARRATKVDPVAALR